MGHCDSLTWKSLCHSLHASRQQPVDLVRLHAASWKEASISQRLRVLPATLIRVFQTQMVIAGVGNLCHQACCAAMIFSQIWSTPVRLQLSRVLAFSNMLTEFGFRSLFAYLFRLRMKSYWCIVFGSRSCRVGQGEAAQWKAQRFGTVLTEGCRRI